MNNETKKNDQKSQPQKLPARRYENQLQKPRARHHARRLPPLTREQKRQRAITRGDAYWTPGCGLILKVTEK